MRRLILTFLSLYCLSASVNAQYKDDMQTMTKKVKERRKDDGWDLDIRLVPPMAKLDKATGWIYDIQRDNWVKGKKEIVNLDNFEDLELGIGILDNKRFLYLKKSDVGIHNYHDENKPQKRWSEKFNRHKIYILDLEQYKQEVSNITDSYNVLYLDLLDNQLLGRKDDIDISARELGNAPFYIELENNSIERTERWLKNAIEEQNKKGIELWERSLKKMKTPNKDKYKLIIKFLIDKNKEKVYFFIFSADVYLDLNSDGRQIDSSFFSAKNVFDQIEITKDIMDIMWSEDIFDFFYYEADYKKFMDFIKKPLEY